MRKKNKTKNKVKNKKIYSKRQLEKRLREMDDKYALLIKELSQKVLNFSKPINRLIASLSDLNAVLLYRKNGEFIAHVMGETIAEKFVHNNINIQKTISNADLGRVFDKVLISNDDMLAVLNSHTEITVGEGVPEEVVKVFKEALGQCNHQSQ